MKLSKSEMHWSNIGKKLKVGVALADRQKKSEDVNSFQSSIEKIAYSSARSTGQLEGFGDAGLVSQLQSGDIIPDELFGWSTKTILAALLLLLLFKVKKLQGVA